MYLYIIHCKLLAFCSKKTVKLFLNSLTDVSTTPVPDSGVLGSAQLLMKLNYWIGIHMVIAGPIKVTGYFIMNLSYTLNVSSKSFARQSKTRIFFHCVCFLHI